MISCILSYDIHILNVILLFILYIQQYPDIYPAGYSIRFSADPARRGMLLDQTLLCLSCSATG
jgi:hypothetical protein